MLITIRKNKSETNNFGFPKPNLTKRLAYSALTCVLGYAAMDSFVERYTIMIDYTGYRCLDARVLVVDKYDKSYEVGDIVAIDGRGVPVLPDEHRYIKLVAGKAGDTVTFDGERVKSSSGFDREAPLGAEYENAKKKYNLGSEWTLTNNEIFLIGDTPHSLDGRVVGPSNPDHIIGKAYVLL